VAACNKNSTAMEPNDGLEVLFARLEQQFSTLQQEHEVVKADRDRLKAQYGQQGTQNTFCVFKTVYKQDIYICSTMPTSGLNEHAAP
jgi:hypothetical protein